MSQTDINRIYFDYNASHPIRPEAAKAVTAALAVQGNASAIHSDGRAVQKRINEARSSVAKQMGVCDQDLIFTSSATEADNMAVFSAWKAGCRHLLFSSSDHPASYRAAQDWGCAHEFIPLDAQGRTDLGWLRTRLANWDADWGRIFVSVAAVNSESGIMQPVAEIADLVTEFGGLLLVDAAQALGKVPMDYMADYLAVSAHKIGGPQGVGALYVAPDAPISSLLCGGGQERRRRAGTMNMAGIAGFGAAAEALDHRPSMEGTRAIRDKIEAGLKALEPNIFIIGEGSTRLPNTSFFALADMSAETMVMALDLAGISLSTGTACSSGKVEVSRVIEAMGLADKAPKGALRLSLGEGNTLDEADRFLAAWAKIRARNQEAA